MAVLATALRDPKVAVRYQSKVHDRARLELPVVAWAGVRRGHGRFCVATVAADSGDGDRHRCVIAHRFGYALSYGAAALNAAPVLGHGCNNPSASGSACSRYEWRTLGLAR